MSSIPRAIWILFVTSFVRMGRSKRTLLLALAALFPPAFAFLFRTFAPDQFGPHAIRILGWGALIQVVVPATALIGGVAALGDDIEDGTIAYLVTRPVPRAAIFLGRTLACLVWVLLAIGSSAVALAFVSGVGITLGTALDGSRDTDLERAGGALLVAALAGGLTYTTLFAALGAAVRRSMLIGVGYVFAIEVFLANLPGKTRSLTIQHHLREIVRALSPGRWGPPQRFVRVTEPDLSGSAVNLAIVTAIALLLGCWIVSRRQYVRADT